ncbi:hypothetical protein [Escherichia sp. E3659]|uniref:hypothetical protein n=1 Tax=Escherichia sp. E3659 TaxID=2044462 RepID=UPI00197AF915
MDVLPDVLPEFTPDADLLCDYAWRWRRYWRDGHCCRKLKKTLTGLVCELVWYFADSLNAPRWIRTADGVQVIDGRPV